MASKVIGFRIPEDVAEELEKVSEERGMKIAEFMRSLVDETLYPASDNNGQEKDDSVTLEQLESLANEHKDLVDQVESLSVLINHIGVKIAKYETEGILSQKQVETMQAVETLKNQVANLGFRFTTTSITAKNVQDVITLVKDNKVSTDRTYDELRKEVSHLRSQLGTVTGLPLKVRQIESDMTHMTTNISSLKRDVKRQPADDIHSLTYKNGSEHRFRVYKSPAGLVKPHVVINDLILGKKYVDLTEPLD